MKKKTISPKTKNLKKPRYICGVCLETVAWHNKRSPDCANQFYPYSYTRIGIYKFPNYQDYTEDYKVDHPFYNVDFLFEIEKLQTILESISCIQKIKAICEKV
jgi:hypothetical protein